MIQSLSKTKRNTFSQLMWALLLLPFFIQGQSKADSIQRVIANQASDTSKVASYLALYEALKFTEPSKSTVSLRNALKLSTDLGFEKGKAQTLIAIGNFLYTSNKYDSALTAFTEAQKLAQQEQLRSLTIEALCRQANVLNDLRRLEESDSILQSALYLSLKEPVDSSMVALCYNNLGNLAFTHSQYDKALDFYQKTLNYNGNKGRTAAAINMNIGLIHFSQGNLLNATDYLEKGLAIAVAIKEEELTAQSYNYLGMVYRSLKNYEQATEYYGRAKQHYEKVNDLSSLAHVHTNIANIHKDQGAYTLAIAELETCLELLNQVNYPLGECYTLNNLGELYFRMDDFATAKTYFEKVFTVFGPPCSLCFVCNTD